jgi:hypothetical protein
MANSSVPGLWQVMMKKLGLSSPEKKQPDPPGGTTPAGLVVGFETLELVVKSTKAPLPLEETKVILVFPQAFGAVAQSAELVCDNTLPIEKQREMANTIFFSECILSCY